MDGAAKLTSKGQLTLPVDIRPALGVRGGDSVVFEMRPDGITVRPIRETGSRFEKFRGIGDGSLRGRKAIQRWVRDIRGEL